MITTGSHHVVLYVRSSLPVRSAYESTLEELERLRDAGVVGSVEIEYWPNKADLTGEDDCPAAEEYSKLRDWAERSGAELEPFFRCCSYRSSLTRTECELVELPTLSMVVYDGDEIQAVYPCEMEGEHVSVADGLEELSARLVPVEA